MWSQVDTVLRWASRFTLQDWLLIGVVALIFGAFCLRGYGSRQSY